MKTIIEMAREAFIARGFWPNEVMWACWRDAWLAGAKAEREACAKQLDALGCDHCAAAIRARGQA
jgi:hypothetical protein